MNFKAFAAAHKGQFSGRNKFNAKRCVIDGHRFDSLTEGARYEYWKARLKVGNIAHIDVHPVVTLPGGIRYTPDFGIWVDSACWDGSVCARFEDVKGVVTEAFKLKRKLFDATHPAAPLSVVKGRKTARGYVWTEI